ncbi:MAG: 3-dehydroquinate synthase [Muribaculaceae bacterium]|nr:3-dehydroquinate synthase [Muribaculaceae bacterium]
MKHQDLIFSNDVASHLDALVEKYNPSKLFILVDKNTRELVLPILVNESKTASNASVITIEAGDTNKNIESLMLIWSQLVEGGATRKSMLINLGGGVVTDIGGFAGATFKRGIRFVNIPTTLLSAVDAAVGGKTGINFHGFKNEIGAFCEAEAVIISTRFLSTLSNEELLSGYAEMLKHGLISNVDTYNRLIAQDVTNIDAEQMLLLLQESVLVKKHIVEEDPTEKGIRRALNLGHTAGHAFESLALHRKSPIPHGYAVAWGLVVELVLSHMQLKFPSNELSRLATYIYENYGAFHITCDDYPSLIEFMRHDKKNDSANEINFTMLKNVGDIHIDCIATEEDIKTALDIYRDFMHI